MLEPKFITSLHQKKNDTVIIFISSEENIPKKLKSYHLTTPEKLSESFEGKYKQILTFYQSQRLVVLVGLGDEENSDIESKQSLYAYLENFLHKLNLTSRIYITPSGQTENNILDICYSLYDFDIYKTTTLKKTKKSKKGGSKKTRKLDKKNKISFLISKKDKKLKNIPKLLNAINLVRNLGNEPGNILHPPEYIKRIIAQGKKSGFQVRVMSDKKLKQLGMNSLLSVSSGSKYPGYLVELTLRGKRKGPLTCLVGKGITFDTGGMSLKSSKGMDDMKTDMLGSATVLGTIDYLAQIKSPKNVMGLMAIAENMIGPDATRPGDIVTAYNGKTIEIMNTDAEGRLVLADALGYCEKKYQPKEIIDLATLTGQQEAISCSLFSSIMGNQKELNQKLIRSGEKVEERLLEFTIYPEFKRHTESDIADVKNSDFKCKADMIQAGAFLSNFVSDKVAWAHIDIAGPARRKTDTTGHGVRILVEYLTS